MAPAATPAPSTAAGSPVPSKRTHSEAGSGDDEVIDEVCVPRFFPVRKVEEMRSLNTASPPSTRRFASKIVEVFVGEKKYHFSVHEAFLFESAELKSAYLSTPKSKRGKNSNMMYLPRDDPKEIGHLLEYLYLKKLTVNATSPKAQVEELLSIWAMGCKHGVADMQRLVIQKLEEFDIANKLPAMQFLKLADQLYESDVDFGLRRYFNTVAPRVVRKLASRDMTALLDIISEGGTFASDVFNAHHRAFRGASKGADTLRAPSPPPSNIKVEEGTVNRNTNTAKRARSEASEATPSSHADTAGASAGPDNLTEWDRENGIPSAWETAAPEDRLLTLMAQQGKSWNSISQAWERATGTKESINVLIHRLQRIEAVMVQLKPGDSDRLNAAKTEIESKFAADKWHFIAARIVEKGGHEYEPVRLQSYCAALDSAAERRKAAEASLVESKKGALNEESVQTEIVGGVRVLNSQPINKKRSTKKRMNIPVPAETKGENVGMGGTELEGMESEGQDLDMEDVDEDTWVPIGKMKKKTIKAVDRPSLVNGAKASEPVHHQSTEDADDATNAQPEEEQDEGQDAQERESVHEASDANEGITEDQEEEKEEGAESES